MNIFKISTVIFLLILSINISSNIYAQNTVEPAFIFNTEAGVQSSPAIGIGGTVYVHSSDGFLHAFDPISGGSKWTFDTGGGSSSPAIGNDGSIYVASTTGLFSIDPIACDSNPSDCAKWKHLKSIAATSSSPALDGNGTFYVGRGYEGLLTAFNSNDGTVKWYFRTGSSVFFLSQPLELMVPSTLDHMTVLYMQ